MLTRLMQNRTRWGMPAAGVLLAMGLSACAAAPGGHIDYEAESDPLSEVNVDVQPITLDLIQEMNATTRDPADVALVNSGRPAESTPDYDYYIGRGDVLNIIVYDHPELTIPAGSERSAAESGNVVHSDGTIFYPYVGQVNVVGRTVHDVRNEIQRRLADFIAEPQVDVKVAAYNSQKAYVTGQVNSPGQFPITNVPLRVLDAISQAGGLTDSANWREVVLSRDNTDTSLSVYEMLVYGDLKQNLLLEDGDVLHVPEVGNQQVFVMGQVNQPASLAMGNTRLSLTAAISQAGGIDEGNANASGIFVIRRNPVPSDTYATVYQLDASNAAAFVIGSQFMLEPTDVVYVTAAPLARWNRVLRLLLPSLTTIYQATEVNENIQDL
ncbi:polysaccharide export protein [Modicisalibacter luteus]|nr:polysaccharide export protein [Halomonas lutea]